MQSALKNTWQKARLAKSLCVSFLLMRKILRLFVRRWMPVRIELALSIHEFFTTDNRSGCRFITVDAYREAVAFYEKNGFVVAKTVEDEEDRRASTIAMFFDLKRIAQ